MRLANGYGTIVNLGGNRRKPFAIRFSKTVNDERQFKYLSYHATKEDALDALVTFNRDCGFDDIEKQKMTFSEVYELWKRTAGKKLAEKNLKDYNMAFNLTELIHNFKFNELTAGHMQYVLDECEKSHATKSKIKTLFNKLYKFANEYKISRKNEAQYLELSGSTTRRGKIFTNEEIDVLWEDVANYDSQNYLILIYTGLRITEFLTLELKNIDLENQIMLSRNLKKGENAMRRIPIHDDILPIIKERMTQRIWLVENEIGSVPYSSFNQRWNTRYKNIHRIHDTRHTAISLMNRAGVSDTLQKIIVGHVSGDVTKDVYTHVTSQELVDAINLI